MNALRVDPLVWVRFAALPLRRLDRAADTDAMWNDADVREAVELASPSLARALSKPGRRSDVEAKRLYLSLRSYYIRMCSRSTPFGLMAGVFSGFMCSEKTIVQLDLGLVRHVRLARLARVADGFDDQTVIQANRGLERTGHGFLVPPRGSVRSWQQDADYIEATSTMLRVVEMLKEPSNAMGLAGLLSAQSGRGRDEWLEYLQHLEQRNVVVRFEGNGYSNRAITPATPAPGNGHVHDVSPDQNLSAAEISIDAFAAGADGAALPRELGDQALVICQAIDLANPSPIYPPHLQAMALDFNHRFGPGAEVPLLKTFSVLHGIPLRPRGQLQRGPWNPESPLTPREQALSAAVDAVELGGTIDDSSLSLLSELASADTRATVPPYAPMQEVCLRPTVGAGGLTSEMTFAGAASALGGRFSHLLTPRGRAAQQALIESADRCFGQIDVAELVVAPAIAGRRLFAITPLEASRQRVVSVGPAAAIGGAASLGPGDILVGVNAETGRIYLRSVRSGRQLHLVQSSMARDELLQPIEAFLLQVCRAQFRYASTFNWGALFTRTFLPAIKVGSTYLCTSRWLLNGSNVCENPRALQDWMERWEIPDSFMARPERSDRGLLLRRKVDDELLLHMLRRTSPATIAITPAPDAHGDNIIRGIDGESHVSDVVVTVLCDNAGKDGSAAVRTTPALAYRHDDTSDVGSEWAVFELCLPWAVIPHFLGNQMGQWLSDLTTTGSSAIWWDITQQLPDSLIRVYLPTRQSGDHAAIDALWQKCRKARRDGDLARICQTEHHVHEGLIRDRQALALAHQFFAADARATIAIARSTPSHTAQFTFRSSLHLYKMLSGSGRPRTEIRTLAKQLERGKGRGIYEKISRDLYDEVSRGSQPDEWLDRWTTLTTALGPHMSKLIGPLTELSLSRLCVSSLMRPHIFGAVRRLIDREIFEMRGSK